MKHSPSSEVSAVSARRVRALLLAYGADPARWPPAERVAAQRVLEQWPELQALAEREATLDAVLDEDRVAGDLVMDEAALLRCLPAGAGPRPPWRLPSVSVLVWAGGCRRPLNPALPLAGRMSRM
jgi:hypothetical protein